MVADSVTEFVDALFQWPDLALKQRLFCRLDAALRGATRATLWVSILSISLSCQTISQQGISQHYVSTSD